MARHLSRTSRVSPDLGQCRALRGWEKTMTTIEAPITPVYLDETAAATRLLLAPKTLRNWRAVGTDGPPYLKLGRSVRYPTAMLDAWAMKKVA